MSHIVLKDSAYASSLTASRCEQGVTARTRGGGVDAGGQAAKADLVRASSSPPVQADLDQLDATAAASRLLEEAQTPTEDVRSLLGATAAEHA